jgi:hypothetical protein
MKSSIALMLLAAVVVTGCARPVVRETVVEKPVIVDRPAAAGSSTASCTYASQSFSQGAISCQEKTEFRCNSGNWERTLNTCQ